VITAVDTNIIIDILEPDPVFGPASRAALKSCFQDGSVIACEVVWAEVTTAYGNKIEEAVDVMSRIGIEYSAMTLEATLEAAKRWSIFIKKTKARDRIVADFLVGGHAIALSDQLLTRDRGFYRDYFKPLKIKTP
jgi:predicted nucleic acid-binding protein